MFRSGADRGQSELIGIVLLFGLVIVTATSVFVIGGIAINDVSEEVDLERGLTEMRQADSRMSRVAFGQQGGQVVVFGESDSPAEVQKGSSLRITMNGNHSRCGADIPMGSIVKHVDGGGTIAYEGGGVWRESEGGGVTMVSPPDLQYKNGSVNFPMVSLANATTGQVNSLQITKNVSASQQRNEQLNSTFNDPDCKPPKNMTITVQSDYYEGWGEYMEKRIASNVTYDDGNRTASTTLDRIGETWAASESSVQVDRNFSATVRVLGTALSGSADSIYGPYIFYDPITMSVNIDGDHHYPWPENPDPTVEPWAIRHDINDPDKPEQYEYQFTGKGGTNISVEATSYFGSDRRWAENITTYRNVTYNGEEYPVEYLQRRSTDVEGERISIDSSKEDEKNLVVLEDGDELPSFGEASVYQRSIEDMLGADRIGTEDGEEIVVLDENQAVFVYELSEPNADPDNADGSGDPDYNDAVVLFELDRAEQAESNFFIHVSVSQVQVEEAG